jgi:hypothetical protein
MVSNAPNGFILSYKNTGTSNSNIRTYFETTDQSNSFTETTGINYGAASGNTHVDPKSITGGNGACVFPQVSSSNSCSVFNTLATRGQMNSQAVHAFQTVLSTSNAFGSASVPVAGAPICGGMIVGAVDYTAKNFKYAYAAGAGQNNGSITVTLTFVGSNLANTSGGVAPGGARLAALYGSVMVFTYLDLARNPSFALINVSSASYSTALVAGVTPSNPTEVLSQATGYSLIGVSTSDCPPGGTGNVTINGNATLNSSYPATVTGRSFDFQSPVVFGAKGTQLNRNVNLEGNV